MSRKQKTRRLKDKSSIKTGSKKDFIPPGQKGKIPSHNRLAKHRVRQKPAYLKFLEEQAANPDSDSAEDDAADTDQT